MAITDWPEEDRPREKLLHRGATALTDTELLAIFLRTGVKGESAVDIARGLLKKFGSLRATLEASASEFCKQRGLGLSKFVQLQAVLELGQRHLFDGLQRGEALTSPDLTRKYLQYKLRRYEREVFACLYLDNQHRVIAFEELFWGTLDGSMVHPREVVKSCLRYNAAAVIFSHNHPSGSVDPSPADVNITHLLKAALDTVDIRVLDHMIIGETQVVSLAEKGLL